MLYLQHRANDLLPIFIKRSEFEYKLLFWIRHDEIISGGHAILI